MKLPSFISDTLNFFNPPKITVEELLEEKKLELCSHTIVVFESKIKEWVLNYNGYFDDCGTSPEYEVILTAPDGKETVFNFDKPLEGVVFKNFKLFPLGEFIFVTEISHFPYYCFICKEKTE
ncbi:MAG TPA: hypothetical protein VLH94_02945 [Spirochaetia bacterium]|nr:hypothetical protein [Spirochaetia bacterium]